MEKYKNLRENSTNILERKIKSHRQFVEIWKDVPLKLILTDKSGNGDCLPFCCFWPESWDILNKGGVNRKRGGVLAVVLLRGEDKWLMTYFGEGVTIQINYKIKLIQDSCQQFSLQFMNNFHWLLQVYCITQEMHISQELAFLCITLPSHKTIAPLYFFM